MKALHAYYIVQPRDTLFDIAQRYNTMVEELVKRNDLSDYLIETGKTLKIQSLK